MTNPADTSVVIVNYRTMEFTRAAVDSVLAEPEVAEVIVVDNDSGDGSVDHLRRQCPDPRVRVIASDRNAGFGPAVNLAARECRGPLLFILNSDATLAPASLASLVGALLADPSVGVVAPAVYEADGARLQPGAYGRLPTRRDLVSSRGWVSAIADDDRLASTPGWVSGVAMLLRRDEFLGIGGFDEGFAMYLEDVDLCRRLGIAGTSVRRETAARVLHLGGGSWRSRREPVRRFHQSKLHYFRGLGASPLELACVRLVGLIRTTTTRR